jgi:Predicted membrane protein
MTDEEKKRHQEMTEIELVIGHVLRIGVITSAVVIILGLGLALITGKTGYPAGSFPTTFSAIFQGVAAFKPFAYNDARIILVDPNARVASRRFDLCFC